MIFRIKRTDFDLKADLKRFFINIMLLIVYKVFALTYDQALKINPNSPQKLNSYSIYLYTNENTKTQVRGTH